MDKSEIFKMNRLNRYKSVKQDFKSQDDARISRAIQKQKDQKLKREKNVAKFRGMSTPIEKGSVGPSCFTTKKYTPAERRELGKQRYLEMLKWKEEKKKKIEMEKKKRMPVFKTGVYEPEKPKFLCGEVESASKSVTPWKSSSSLRDSVKRLSSTKPKDLLVSRPVFHSGATPGLGSSTATSVLGNGRSKRRISRSFRPPPTEVDDIAESKRKSFAPHSFNFQAPKSVQNFALNSKLFLQSKSNNSANETSISKKLDMISEVNSEELMTEGKEENIATKIHHYDSESSDNVDVVSKNSEDVPFSKSKNTEENKGNIATQISHYESEDDNNVDVSRNSEEVPFSKSKNSCIPEIKVKEKSLCDLREDMSLKQETEMTENEDFNIPSYTSEKESECPIINTLNAGRTPSFRKSVNLVTPPLAKLRPRTPCSRSTRRSKSAHCDVILDLMTPNSRKKSVKKSVGKKKNVCFEETDKKDALCLKKEEIQAIESFQEDLKEQNVFCTSATKKDTELTPLRINQLDSSPWITRSRGSSSSGRKRRGIYGNPLEELFNTEEPVNGSITDDGREAKSKSPSNTQGSSPNLKQSLILNSQEENGDDEMLKLIQPSRNIFDSPGIDVWGCQSNENTPSVLKSRSILEDRTNELMNQNEREPLQEVTSCITNTRYKGGRSKRSSVTFTGEQDIKEDLEVTKYPRTPGRKSRCFSRSKERVSLLPGLFPYNEEGINENSPIGENVDLITFDSPAPYHEASSVKKRKSYSNTPLRRSKRLSKVS